MKILFINAGKLPCSIFESGRMAYNALEKSQKYSIEYHEISIENPVVPAGYDIYLFNYHFSTMRWLDATSLGRLQGLKLTLVLEVSPDDPFPFLPPKVRKCFDGFIVLDPTVKHPQQNVFAFPRPLLDQTPRVKYVDSDIPIIGTSGICGLGKFHHVVDAVSREFDKAIVRIHAPFSPYDSDPKVNADLSKMLQYCIRRAKPGIEIQITQDCKTQQEMLDWSAQNTLNCFLYDRDMPGLSAATDQAILSGRPLAVANNNTFRHILKYIPPYPQWSLKGSIERSAPMVQQMREDWSTQKFMERFEQILDSFHIIPEEHTLQLPATQSPIKLDTLEKQNSLRQHLFNCVKTVYRATIKKNATLHSFARKLYARITGEKIVDRSLTSYSQLFEDIYLSRIFYYNSCGSYLDIGGKHPTLYSRTYLFYKKGWKGINIVFDEKTASLFRDMRKHDTTICYHLNNSDTPLVDAKNADINKDRQSKKWLTNILEEHMSKSRSDFDILSINAPGLEKDILEKADWTKYRPKIVVVTACAPSDQGLIPPDEQDATWRNWEYVLEKAGFSCVLFDGLNRFYLRNEDLFLEKFFAIPASPELDAFVKANDGRRCPVKPASIF